MERNIERNQRKNGNDKREKIGIEGDEENEWRGERSLILKEQKKRKDMRMKNYGEKKRKKGKNDVQNKKGIKILRIEKDKRNE